MGQTHLFAVLRCCPTVVLIILGHSLRVTACCRVILFHKIEEWFVATDLTESVDQIRTQGQKWVEARTCMRLICWSVQESIETERTKLVNILDML